MLTEYDLQQQARERSCGCDACAELPYEGTERRVNRYASQETRTPRKANVAPAPDEQARAEVNANLNNPLYSATALRGWRERALQAETASEEWMALYSIAVASVLDLAEKNRQLVEDMAFKRYADHAGNDLKRQLIEHFRVPTS